MPDRLNRVVVALLVSGVLPICAAQTAPLAQEADSNLVKPQPAGAAPTAPAVPLQRPNANLKAFREVLKDAQKIPGYFTLWKKDDKVWMEIPAAMMNQPFLFSLNVTDSVGERGLYSGQMGPSYLASFRKVGNLVQLVAHNTDFRAEGDPAVRDAVRQGFSDSLLAVAPVASNPDPADNDVLIDAAALLFSDIPMYAQDLDNAFRMSFSFDARNSRFVSARSTDDTSAIGVQAHYYAPRFSDKARPSSVTPDPRSLFVGFLYNFAKLPETPMTPRAADERIGHFTSSYTDFANETAVDQRVHRITRWRLEKKDPNAPLSEPQKPIVFWLDKNIPERYRGSIRAGILEWNKAFERVGFSNAIVVEQQPKDAEWDTMEAGRTSVRWFLGEDSGFARGPSRIDPRTGEILDADIAMSDAFGRSARRFYREDRGNGSGTARVAGAGAAAHAHSHHDYCDYARDLTREVDFAMDLLEARGDLAPESAEAEAFVQAYVKEIIMHEVGHTLGLRHNFRASTVYSLAQLQDKNFTDQHGVASSVMDYIPFNVAAQGEKQGSFVNTTLGPYDYWAIEYAYKPLAPNEEAAGLAAIAARSTDPLLAYATDDDVGGRTDGIDPEVNLFDLGADPLAYFKKRLQLSRELWERAQSRALRPNEDYQALRRNVVGGFAQLRRVSTLVGKYIGGVTHVRDHAGSGRATFTPISAAKQKEALEWLTRGMFQSDSFRFQPSLLNRLAPNYFNPQQDAQFDITSAVLDLQTRALDKVMSASTAERVLAQDMSIESGSQIFSLADVYDTLQAAIWSELKTGKEIDRLRRNVQREHLKRLTKILTRSADMPADAVSLVRMQALSLQASLDAAQVKARKAPKKLSRETLAHLAESEAMLAEALRASFVRHSS